MEKINSYSFDGEAVLTAGDGVETGKVSHYINGKFDFHQRVYKISNFNQKLKGYFFFVYFSSNFYNQIMQMTAKSSVDSALREMIAEMKILVQPPAKQEAIAEALSNADALVAALDRLISKKRDIKQGAMQQLLTGGKRLPGFSGAWETKKLGEIAPPQRCFDLPNKELKAGIYPVVYLNGILNKHKIFKAKSPGVITGRSGTICKFHFLEQDYFPHNTTLWVTDFEENDAKFIFYLYVTIKLERFATGSGVPTLNRNDVHSFEVFIPPTIEEQKAIADALSEMDAEIEELEQQRDKYKALKQGMMQKLLTGRIRLF